MTFAAITPTFLALRAVGPKNENELVHDPISGRIYIARRIRLRTGTTWGWVEIPGTFRGPELYGKSGVNGPICYCCGMLMSRVRPHLRSCTERGQFRWDWQEAE